MTDAGYGRCYICLKPDGKWPCPEKDIMSLCHDCGLNYCEDCFQTDDHISTPAVEKDFLRSLEIYEKEAWLAILECEN